MGCDGIRFPVARTGEGRGRGDALGRGGRKRHNAKTHAFRPTCTSPVYLTFAAMPDLFTVNAASLDDSSWYAPHVVTYGVRGHAWDHVDPSLPKFEKMPPA